MGRRKCDWQETKYVLSYFGDSQLKGEGIVRDKKLQMIP